MITSVRIVIYNLVLFPFTRLAKNNYIRAPEKYNVYVILE